MRSRLALRALLALGLGAACSAAPPAPVAPPPAPPRLSTTPPPVTAAVPAPAEAPADAGAAIEAAAPPAPLACPADMKLVEGDYCTEVAHKCLKSWYDKSNKKTICEEFEPGSARCVG